MEHSFWHHKWKINQIGFHLDYIHPLLKRNLELFQLKGRSTKQNRVFIPLCGKTLDIGFLLAQNCSVVAVELSEVAVQEVFEALDLSLDDQPQVSDWLGGKLYQTKNLQIFVGDFFALTAADLGEIVLVYDRAALIALPSAMRINYTQHLATITQRAPQLLITLDFDQSASNGPPFAVPTEDVEALYDATYQVQLIEEVDIIEQESHFKAKGIKSVYERAYELK
jgi:thiopurine S-methyltransferase